VYVVAHLGRAFGCRYCRIDDGGRKYHDKLDTVEAKEEGGGRGGGGAMEGGGGEKELDWKSGKLGGGAN